MTGPTRRSMLSTIGGFAAVGVTGVTAGQSTETTETDDETTYAAQVSPTVRLVDYQLARSGSGTPTPDSDSSGSTPTASTGTATYRLTVECDTPSLLTTMDGFAGLASEGVTEVEQEQTTAPSGRSTLRRAVTTLRGQAALGLAAPNGVVRISTGLPSSGGGSESGLPDSPGDLALLGLGGAAGLGTTVGWHKWDQRRQEGGVSYVE